LTAANLKTIIVTVEGDPSPKTFKGRDAWALDNLISRRLERLHAHRSPRLALVASRFQAAARRRRRRHPR